MPDIRNSGRLSTDQTFFQVGKKPKSTQLTAPTPSPSSAARKKAPATGARSRTMSASVKAAMPAKIPTATMASVTKARIAAAKTASSGLTTG